jgi:lipopolysaccharide biosynthesis regulator YciM
MANQYGNLGNIYRTRGELDKAEEYWQKSLALFTKVGAKNKIAMVREWITEYCSEKE